MDLNEFFKDNPKCAAAFSGGVDSAYLLYAALKAGARVQPYFIKTQFQPQFEYDDALALCGSLGVKLKVVRLDILSTDRIRQNPVDRCYHCKKTLFSALLAEAKKDGYDLIIDGTNASDNAEERPGMKALGELGIRSPLRECLLTKDDVRRLSKEAGLFTWDKPAYACLATRVLTNAPITEDLLNRIENAENALMKMGFSDLRVRVENDKARLQIRDEQFPLAAARRGEIVDNLKPYFGTILLDMEAR